MNIRADVVRVASLLGVDLLAILSSMEQRIAALEADLATERARRSDTR